MTDTTIDEVVVEFNESYELCVQVPAKSCFVLTEGHVTFRLDKATQRQVYDLLDTYFNSDDVPVELVKSCDVDVPQGTNWSVTSVDKGEWK